MLLSTPLPSPIFHHRTASNDPVPHFGRSGSASPLMLLLVASLVALMLLGYSALMLRPEAQRALPAEEPVRVYCAAGIAKPVEEIIANYGQEPFGGPVALVRTGGSGELLGQIKAEDASGIEVGAEIYITADSQLLDIAHSEGLVAERFPLAVQIPVIAARAGSDLKIGSLRDLVARKDVKFGIASERAAVGKSVRQIARRGGILNQLETGKATECENVMTLAQALVTGSLDAAVIWDTTVAQVNRAHQDQGRSPVIAVACPADADGKVKSDIAAGIIASTRRAPDCLRFLRYLASPEKGGEAFEKYGFSFIAGDRWEEVPEIHLYCGSMFTPVLEEEVRRFARREGVNIYPRWEGCGKLVASMKSLAGQEDFPDAYLACDTLFLEEVQPFFQEPVLVSSNAIVMAVNRKYRQQLSDPKDLLQPGIRIGICDPDQSALGRLTRELLSYPPYAGLYDRIQQQAAVTVDVGPTLISQLLAGGLDAAFVYRSNFLADPQASEGLSMIELDPAARKSRAIQPWTISRSTHYPALMSRLYDRLQHPGIQQKFSQFGFEQMNRGAHDLDHAKPLDSRQGNTGLDE